MDSTKVVDPTSSVFDSFTDSTSPSGPKGSSIPTTPTSIGKKFNLAQYRYGREDMLALLPDQPSSPPINPEAGNIISDEPLQPLALLPLGEEEQRILSGSVNSYSAFKRAPPTALSMRGRGGRAPRGRGRGEDHYTRSHSTSEDSTGGEWTTFYSGGRGSTTPGWNPSWEGGPSFKHSRGDQDSNWRSGSKDGEGKWITPTSPGGPQRGGSWKNKENKDRWLPGWAQNTKDSRNNGQHDTQQQKQQQETQAGEVKNDDLQEEELSKPPDQSTTRVKTPQTASSPWDVKSVSINSSKEPSSITSPPGDSNFESEKVFKEQEPEQTTTFTMSHQPEQASKQKQQQQQQPQDKQSIVSTIVENLRPSPTVDVFPSAIGSKETTPLVPPTSLSHQGLAGMFSTPNFTPSFSIRIPLDNVDQDMANRLEKIIQYWVLSLL